MDETVAEYDVASPARRTLVTVIGTIVAVGVIGGLVLGTSILMRDTTVSTTDIELGDSVLIVLDAGAADVRLVEGDADLVSVTARVTSGLRETSFEVGRRGDEIKIASSCQAWLSPGCGVETTIAVPRGLPVEVRTTSGDVQADAIAESVLTVVTGTGDVSTSELAVDELSVTTVSGDVTATFAEQPFAFKATTGSGDISAEVPAGDRTYDVMMTSTSGDAASSIESDDGGEGFVRAASDSGDIALRTR